MGADDSEGTPTTDERRVLQRPSGPFSSERYRAGEVIGSGGMGEVLSAHDEQLGREVAIKRIRRGDPSDATIARFLREARIQGRLEHPAIPAVHELGRDAGGLPFFVMKKLSGTTLESLLKRPADTSRQRLLRAFAEVCLAIEFAHVHGVVHRDLKPSNIMLGEFGEVYVLDWGVAKLRDESDDFEDVRSDGLATRTGTVIGTPGYMAPEQQRGEPDVDARADVYALGRVLVEILDVAPIPTPELDQIANRALAGERGERLGTARAIAEAIHAYLDGDRDLARRRELATEHATIAKAALVESTDDARATAMREAGRALALDPRNPEAQQVLGHTLLSTSAMPAGALVAANRERAETRRRVLGFGALVYGATTLLVVTLLLLPLHHVAPVVLIAALCAAASLLAWRHSTRELPLRTRWVFAHIALAGTLVGLAGWMLGTLLIMPLLMIGAIGIFLSQPTGYPSWMSLVGLVVPPLIAIALELGGGDPSFTVAEGALVLHNRAFDFTPFSAGFILIVAITMQLVHTVVLSVNMRRTQEAAQNQVHAQTWHLQQLLPAPEQA